MRVHITLDRDLVDEIDRLVGPRKRSAYIGDAVRNRLESERRWRKIRSASARYRMKGTRGTRTRPDGCTIPDEKILAAWGDRTGPPELQDHLGSP